MDGVWLYDEEDDWYRLNISGTTGYYTMYFDSYDRLWDVFEIYENGNSSDALMFCHEFDLSECAGKWRIFDEFTGEWSVDPDATSQAIDCSYTECDAIGFTANDTDC